MQKLYESKYLKRRAVRFRIKAYLVIGCILIAAALGAGFVVRSPLFRIEHVAVAGLRGASQEAFLERIEPLILDSSLNRFLGMSHALVWPKTLRLDDPHIASIAIETEFWKRGAKIVVTPRDPFGIWCFSEKSQCVWIDMDGVVIEEAPVPEGVLIPLVIDSAPAMLPAGESVAPKDFSKIKNVIMVFGELDIPVRRYILNRINEEFHVATPSTVVKLSLRLEDYATAVEAFQALIEKEPLTDFEYVDLTVEKRMFVKRR